MFKRGNVMEKAADFVAIPLYERRRKIVIIRTRSRAALRNGRESALLVLALPLKELMEYGIPAVLALVILRHQPKPDALFRDNPAPLWSFVVATAAYWLTAGAITRTRRQQQQQHGMMILRLLRRGALAFGIQSALSLLAMAAMPMCGRPLSLLISVLPLPLAFAYCTWIHPPLITLINKIRSRLTPLNSTNPPNILPLSLSKN